MNFNWRSVGTHSAAATTAAVLALAAAYITPKEGVVTRTYKDAVGVDTVCIGETDKWAVDEGKRRAFTKDECAAMLAKRLPQYDTPMMACIGRAIPDPMHIAFLSAAYNIGVAGFCKSSMARLAKAGDLKGACRALRLYNVAGGHVIKGLDVRRRDEEATCLKGLT